MRADKELFGPAAILAALRLEAGVAEDSAAGAITLLDEFYDFLERYDREKLVREPLRITQTLDDVKYDV